MEDCQFPKTKKIPLVQIKSQNNVSDFFFYIRIWYYKFVSNGQTVNQVYYLEVMERLCEKVGRKRQEIFASNSWFLHHDNASAHMALCVREFLGTKQITV